MFKYACSVYVCMSSVCTLPLLLACSNFTYNEGQRLAALTTRQSSVYFKGRNIFKGNIGVAYGVSYNHMKVI